MIRLSTFRCGIATLTVACGLLGQARSAEPVDMAGVTPCSFSAWSADPDPAGLNVRAAPGRDAPIIGRLPPETATESGYPVEFDVIGSRNGWVLIENATAGGYETEAENIFAGPGWVSGTLIGSMINGTGLYSAPGGAFGKPAGGAREILRLFNSDAPGGAWGPDSVTVERIHGCQGEWVDVTILTPDNQRARGWAYKLCSSQVTTCP